MTPPNYKHYLGDSVYAEIENGMIMLYTSNGEDWKADVIFLNQEVMDALKDYEQRIIEMEKGREK